MTNIVIRPLDGVLARYGNQLGALGEGNARKALARAVNRVTVAVHSRVIRAVTKQSSIPREIVRRSVHRRLARVSHAGAIEGVGWRAGKPISLKHFHARQLRFGVKAKVQGEWKRYAGAFMGPTPGVIAPRLGGHVFVRTSAARLPIEMLFGPSVPEEMVRGESERVFRDTVATMLPARVGHEIGRLLPS